MGGRAGRGSAEKWGEAGAWGRGKCAPPSTPTAGMATSRGLACGARGLWTQEAGAKCMAGQSPRGCEVVVMGMPPLGGQGLAGAGRSRLVQAPEATPSLRTGCWGPAGCGEACAPGGWAPCRPGAVAPCHRWLQSHLVCRRNVPAPDHTLPLLLLAPPARKEGVRELAVFAQAPEWQSETPGPAASDACLLSCRR